MDDPEAKRLWFRTVILPQRPALRARVRRILPSGMELDDLVAETMTRAFATANWREVRSGLAFLTRIARNILIDESRRAAVVSFDFIADIEQLQIGVSTEGQLQARDELRWLERTIAGLPENLRRAFVMRRLEELSTTEIAERMQLSVSSIEKYITRALTLISRAMAEREGEIGDERVQEPGRARGDRGGSGAMDRPARR